MRNIFFIQLLFSMPVFFILAFGYLFYQNIFFENYYYVYVCPSTQKDTCYKAQADIEVDCHDYDEDEESDCSDPYISSLSFDNGKYMVLEECQYKNKDVWICKEKYDSFSYHIQLAELKKVRKKEYEYLDLPIININRTKAILSILLISFGVQYLIRKVRDKR